MRYSVKIAFWFLPALLIYAYLCHQFNFTQDDAYISYRYVENFLDGHGLVYNIGERVEGYTNFGWVVYLILWGVLGGSYIAASKVTGFLLGFCVIVLTYFISRQVFSNKDELFRWLAVYLVGVNQSLAYWSPAGLETAAFAFFAMWSLLMYLRHRRFLIFPLTMSVLIRPEGALLAFIFIVMEVIETRRFPRFTGQCALMALLFCIPLVVFKLVYYGSVLPNPFYAKTALSLDRFADGLEYAGRFLSHYGLYGLMLAVPAVFYKKLPRAAAAIWVYAVLYTIYIVAVGGDVLKVHRFFLPVIGASSLLLSWAVWIFASHLKRATRDIGVLLLAVIIGGLTFAIPRGFVVRYNLLEKRFTSNMSDIAQQMLATDSSDFSVALSTIGIFGYRLQGHDIIDMLGLTDSTVARHPDSMTGGMASTWKERKYNATYVLGRQPDYIMFSTGMKPSAPAEKALLLYKQFHDCYRTVGWVLNEGKVGLGSAVVSQAFKRVRSIEGELVPTYPLEWVELYKKAMEAYIAGDQMRAIYYYDLAAKASPEPVYIYVAYQKALSHVLMQQHGLAAVLMDSVIARDSLIYMAHAQLLKYAVVSGDQAKADIHRRWLKKLVPWYLPRVEAQAANMLRSRRPN